MYAVLPMKATSFIVRTLNNSLFVRIKIKRHLEHTLSKLILLLQQWAVTRSGHIIEILHKRATFISFHFLVIVYVCNGMPLENDAYEGPFKVFAFSHFTMVVPLHSVLVMFDHFRIDCSYFPNQKKMLLENQQHRQM